MAKILTHRNSACSFFK